MSEAAPVSDPGDSRGDELIRRIRAGDEAALDIALQRHWTPLVAYLARWLGSEDLAEDVAQRTFLRFWERRARWDDRGSLRALLFHMARNLAISEQRQQRARGRADARFAEDGGPIIGPTPLDAVAARELGRALDREIAALPERRREVFVLRCVHGLAYREIAAVMDISEQTVANQLSRALAALRAKLLHLLAE